ncbi:MAG: hypothetical protein NZ703_03155 [Gemmataceae bacterium]|nr:hypothetical protein [Gemmataceae bacterium]
MEPAPGVPVPNGIQLINREHPQVRRAERTMLLQAELRRRTEELAAQLQQLRDSL